MLVLDISWSFALVLCGIGIGCTFLVLVLLIGFIKVLSSAVKSTDKKSVASEQAAANPGTASTTDSHPTAHEQAAIAMAMHLYFDAHDDEPHVITIEEVEKRYSPWSSKIYSVRNFTK